MQKYRVAVLRGGPSEEYDVSMKTGAAVLESLASSPYEPLDIIISKKGEWVVGGFVRTPQAALAAVDAVFIALHGAYGEDGVVQRELERLHIPYTGSTAFASNVAMDKVRTKEVLKDSGLKMARHFVVHNDHGDLTRTVTAIETLFGPEYVVKPHNSGSSLGTHIVRGSSELYRVLNQSLKERPVMLVEERILGKEATVGVVERFRGQPVYRLPAIEIVPPAEQFFDYTNKYNGQTAELCPGRFSVNEKKRLEDAAELVHRTLGLSQYSRSDFIVTKDDIYFLEVNTLPGLTSESLLPKSLVAVGCPYNLFLQHLISDLLMSS